MSLISDIMARQILDSRGNPTVEVEVLLESGITGRASVPSGASTGTREAIELRDGQKDFSGKGVTKAVNNILEEIGNEVIGMDALRQVEIDEYMIDLDGTENKSRLGANAMLGVSLAVARAAARYAGLPLYQYLGGTNAKVLPVPMMNIINGGAHAANNLDIQEFMIMPLGAATFADALRMGAETFHTLRTILNKDGLSTAVGDEGGFAPSLKSHAQAFEYISRAVEEAGYQLGPEISLAIDAAASEFYRDGRYHFPGEKLALSADELIDYYQDLAGRFPIISIEDALAESDWEGWQ
ncbi:MAG: phosphopyruvate hydratase, partial [Desulfonatronovibrionaceae bacterium]